MAEMKQLEKDLTTLGGGLAQAFAPDYKLEDYEVPKVETTTKGPSISSNSGSDSNGEAAMVEPPTTELDFVPDAMANLEAASVTDQRKPRMSTKVDSGMLDGMVTSQDTDPLDEPKVAPQIKSRKEETEFQPTYKTLEEANPEFIGRLKMSENASKEGFKNNLFFPIKSKMDAEHLNPTGQEIGYGVQVEAGWLSDNSKKWPVIDGVRVDVRQGITEQQATSLVAAKVSEVQSQLSNKVPDWKRLASPFQTYLTDLAYNGGAKAIEKNPSAIKALEKGYPVEAVIKTFDYWTAVNPKTGEQEATRGLLNRRVNSYNQMAEAIGAPLVESYEWGGGQAIIKFESPLISGVKSYKGKDTATFKAKSITQKARTYKPTNGVF